MNMSCNFVLNDNLFFGNYLLVSLRIYMYVISKDVVHYSCLWFLLLCLIHTSQPILASLVHNRLVADIRIIEYLIDYQIFAYYLPNSNIRMENSEIER